MKCNCKKNCRNSESILSFSYENTIIEGANMRPVKACAPGSRAYSSEDGVNPLLEVDMLEKHYFLRKGD